MGHDFCFSTKLLGLCCRGIISFGGSLVSFEHTLSALIGNIYDCAIDPSLWDSTLPKLTKFLQSRTIVIDIVSPIFAKQPLRRILEHGLPPGATQTYLEKYSSVPALINSVMLYDVGDVAGSREIFGQDGLNPFPEFKQWVKETGLLAMIGGVVRKDALRMAVTSVTRLEPYEDEDKERLRLLLPHLRRCITIAQLIDDRTVERERLSEIIERLTAAVFLIDAAGTIHHANANGHRMLAHADVLMSRNGRLTSLHPHEQTALLDSVAAGNAGAQAVTLGARDGKAMVATILPLENGYRREASGVDKAAAAIFIDNPAGRLEWRGDHVAKLFKLTGAELQLLLALLEGLSLQNAADRFGVALPTTKTHLQRIFAKTGTSRQADLIRKVAMMAPLTNQWQPHPPGVKQALAR